MTWNDVTVRQWQQLCDLYTGDANDVKTPTIAILTGMTEAQVDGLPAETRQQLLDKFAFTAQAPDGVNVKFIKVNGRRYRCVYDVRQIRAARYIESKIFSKDPNGNIHRIAASMVVPQRRTWLRWRDAKYDATRHEQYAEDMLDVPIPIVLGSVLFFCDVYRNWIANSQGYLIKSIAATLKMTAREAGDLVLALQNVMDGILTLKRSPNTNASRWQRFMNSQLSTFLMTSPTLRPNVSTNDKEG